MKKVIKIVLMVLAIVAVGGIIGVFTLGPRLVEESVNSFVTAQAPSVATEVESLHERLFIADLHADSLLWGRNLLERADYGHVDVPRLIEANVALQVFSVFTKVPRARSYDRTEADSDPVTLAFHGLCSMCGATPTRNTVRKGFGVRSRLPNRTRTKHRLSQEVNRHQRLKRKKVE